MPLGPARLAAATGATLLVIGCWFTPGGWGIRFHPPVPVPDRSAARLEGCFYEWDYSRLFLRS